MTFDPVPWFVGGGAEHSPEVARLLAYAATSGAEGIVDALDLKVSALGTPAASIKIGPGAGIVRSRTAGGTQQTYMIRNAADETVSIATTSTTARNDLIAVRVEDPWMPGEPWADPANPKVGPYVKAVVYPNVTAANIATYEAAVAYLRTQGHTAIPVGAVVLPTNTTAVTTGMVRDLRKVARPRRERRVAVFSPGAQTSMVLGTATSRTQFTAMSEPIVAPDWATQVKMIVTVGNTRSTGDLTGSMRAEYGYNGFGPIVTPDAGLHHYDPSAANQTRQTTVIGGELVLPTTMRGKSHFVRLYADITSGTGTLYADTLTNVVVDLEFVEVAE